MPRTASVAFVLFAVAAALAQERPPTLDIRLDEPTFSNRTPETKPPSGKRDNLMGGGIGGGGGGPPGYDLTWYPSRSLSNQLGELGLVRQGLNVGMPMWRGEDGNMLLGSVGVRNTLFQTNATLPDTGRPFPKQLWNLSFNANYLHRFESGWTGMLLAGFGSASDRPFESIREVTATLGGFVMIPVADGRDRWQVGLIYLYGGAVNFPLPILSYQWNPSDRLKVGIGLPFSVNWRPADDWEFQASYVPLLNINARLTHTLTPGVQVYGGYEFGSESYLLADRANTRDRFFGFEQRVVGGGRWEVGKVLTVELNGGYGFGRYYGEGENQLGTLRDRVDVKPGPFLGLKVGVRF